MISWATSGASTCPIPSEANWKVELIAKLTDPIGKPQPITTGVRIEIDQNNNVDRYLFVGTGKLLGSTNAGHKRHQGQSVVNSFYVIRDGTRTAAEPAPAIDTVRAPPTLSADLNRSTQQRRGIHGSADRSRLVSGCDRSDREDRHRRLCRRADRRLRVLEAARPTRARLRCRRRLLRPRLQHRQLRARGPQRRHRGRAMTSAAASRACADPGPAGERRLGKRRGPRAGDDDEGRSLQLRHQAEPCGVGQASAFRGGCSIEISG